MCEVGWPRVGSGCGDTLGERDRGCGQGRRLRHTPGQRGVIVLAHCKICFLFVLVGSFANSRLFTAVRGKPAPATRIRHVQSRLLLNAA